MGFVFGFKERDLGDVCEPQWQKLQSQVAEQLNTLLPMVGRHAEGTGRRSKSVRGNGHVKEVIYSRWASVCMALHITRIIRILNSHLGASTRSQQTCCKMRVKWWVKGL